MAAYIVFTRERTRNASELEAYAPKSRASIEGHPVTVRAAYGRQEVLEAPQVEGVVIMEFPSFDAAKAWYDSPAYREAREHRFKGADYRAVIVQGAVRAKMAPLERRRPRYPDPHASQGGICQAAVSWNRTLAL